eukprot:2507898-Pleurochrysis_carterae.AAC.7
MCAFSNANLEKALAVPDSTDTLCSVRACILTLDQVIMGDSDKDSAEHADNNCSGASTDVPDGELTTDAHVTDKSSEEPAADEAVSGSVVPSSVLLSDSDEHAAVQTARNATVALDDATTGAKEAVSIGVAAPPSAAAPGLSVTASGFPPAAANSQRVAEPQCTKAAAIYSTETGDVGAAADSAENLHSQADLIDVDLQSANAQTTFVGKRIRELSSNGSYCCDGMIFLEVESQVGIAFDDLTWAQFPKDKFEKDFDILDMLCVARSKGHAQPRQRVPHEQLCERIGGYRKLLGAV